MIENCKLKIPMPDNIIHRRRSIRLFGYDYSLVGMYFVTLCAQNKALFFTNNQIKKMIDMAWQELTNKFTGIDLDQYIIMPNHLHGSVVLKPVGANLCVRPKHVRSKCVRPVGQTHRPARLSGGSAPTWQYIK